MKALILAGGKGERLGVSTMGHNKCMLRLHNKPLIQYSIENAVKAGVSEIIIVVGFRAEEIINTFGNHYGAVRIKYVIQYDPQGLVHAIECTRDSIEDADFMLFLADEVLQKPRHREMIGKFYAEDLFVICGVVHEPNLDEIRKTYAIIQDEAQQRIYRLIEKPRNPINHIRGTGNCIFRNAILDYIELTPINQSRKEKELPDLIQCSIDDGHMVKSFDIGQGYFNVNLPEDLERVEKIFHTNLDWSDTPVRGDDAQ